MESHPIGKPQGGSPGFHDPRLRGFRTRTSVEAVGELIRRMVRSLEAESVDLEFACGRVLAGPVTAREPVPGFDRAAMDGFAVRGEETFGTDPYNPAPFRVVGRSRPGEACLTTVGPGEAVAIATGAPLPPGADAVVKVEATRVEAGTLLVFEAVPPGRHVSRTGEDIRAGEVVLPGGRVLRPQDLGALSAIGRAHVELIRQPAVRILVTGDELLKPGTVSGGARIADANSPMLQALVRRDGGVPVVVGPLADDRALIDEALAAAVKEADLVMISGGSSTGPEDFAPGILAERGELAVHGVALRPASPTGLGFLDGVPVLLLPGNPVSCLCGYDFFGGPIVRRLGGRPAEWPYPRQDLPLSRKISSMIGRVDYARVRLLEDGRVEPISVSGASILSSTTKADGFVIVPAELEGYPEGAEVTVSFYDGPNIPR